MMDDAGSNAAARLYY